MDENEEIRFEYLQECDCCHDTYVLYDMIVGDNGKVYCKKCMADSFNSRTTVS